MPAVTITRLRDDLSRLYVPPCGAVATWRKIRQVLDEFERHAGVKRTSDLNPPAVAAWLTNAPVRSLATTKTLLSSFRRACTYAKSQGWLRCSPFEVRKLSHWLKHLEPSEDNWDDEWSDDDNARCRHHSLADLVRVMGYLSAESAKGWEQHRLFALATATAYTGARAKEVQCAKVADFNLARKFFRVVRNERRGLKTKPSRRRIPLPPELIPVLDDWLPLTGSIWAFPGARRKTPWQEGATGRKPLDRLKAAGMSCGVEGLTFLSLRHSFITHSAGPWRVPDLLTQKIAGHSKATTTAGYRGFDRANLLDAVSTISFGLTRPLPTEGESIGKAQTQSS